MLKKESNITHHSDFKMSRTVFLSGTFFLKMEGNLIKISFNIAGIANFIVGFSVCVRVKTILQRMYINT